MKIAIDIDDVLTDMYSTFSAHFEKNYGAGIIPEKNHSDEWWCESSESLEIGLERIFRFFQSNEIFTLSPMEKSLEVLKKLKESHELVVVTSRPETLMEKTREWIELHFPGIFSEIYSTDFHMVQKGRKLNKGIICERVGADILIDDYPKFANECKDINTEVWIFDRPWNRSDEVMNSFERVCSWEDIYNKLK